MAMQMQHRKDGHGVRGGREEDSIRKVANQCTSGTVLDRGKLQRILCESGEDGIDLRPEAGSKTRAFTFISKGSLEDLELRLR